MQNDAWKNRFVVRFFVFLPMVMGYSCVPSLMPCLFPNQWLAEKVTIVFVLLLFLQNGIYEFSYTI